MASLGFDTIFAGLGSFLAQFPFTLMDSLNSIVIVFPCVSFEATGDSSSVESMISLVEGSGVEDMMENATAEPIATIAIPSIAAINLPFNDFNHNSHAAL